MKVDYCGVIVGLFKYILYGSIVKSKLQVKLLIVTKVQACKGLLGELADIGNDCIT